jgi:O-Antigen ligase
MQINVLIGRLIVVIGASFFLYNLWKRPTTRNYLQMSLYLFPMMDFTVTPGEYGALQLMEILNYFSFFMLFRNMNIPANKPGVYYVYAGLFSVFFLIVLMGGIVSEFPGTSLLEMVKFFPIFIYAKFLIDECLQDPDFVDEVIRILRISTFIGLAFLAIQLVIGLKFTYYEGLNQNTFAVDEGGSRYPGFFQDSQANSCFLAMSSFLFLYNLPGEEKAKTKKLLYFFVVVIGIFLSGGRSGLAGFAIGMGIVFLLAGRKYLLLLIGSLSFGLIVKFFLADYFLIFNRAANIDESFKTRYELWVRAYAIFMKNPLMGIGIGNYLNYVTYHDQEQYNVVDDEYVYFSQPENGYLKLLTELGFIGCLIFLLFILIAVFRAVGLYLRKRVDHQIILLVAAILCWLFAFNTVFLIGEKRIFIMMATITCLILTYPKRKSADYE